MNIIKGLTAMTSLTVFMGMMTPTAIVNAKTSSTNDNHEVKTNDLQDYTQSAGFSIVRPSSLAVRHANENIFGNGLLQQGVSNDSVARLQGVLHKLGYYNGSINGFFDKNTFAAVSAFQIDRNITDTGIVGAATKTALFDVFRNTSEYKAYQTQLASIKAEELKIEKEKARVEQAKKEAEAKAAAEAAAKAAREKEQQKKNQPAVQNESYQPQSNAPAAKTGRSITVLATSYALSGRTATGFDLGSNPGARVIAVDPSIIPLGSRVMIPGFGVYLAADTGGAIKGNRIDVHFATQGEALNFGVKTLTVQVLN